MISVSAARGDLIDTPLGPMLALVDQQGALLRLDFLPADQALPLPWQGYFWERDSAAVTAVAAQLEEYFSGRRQAFELPLSPRGTAYQHLAWSYLRQVPYGTTLSYLELGARLPHKTSARAIGRANALNPIAIVVPCHRIIGANGSLTGYAGGLARKQALLALEGIAMPGCQQLLL